MTEAMADNACPLAPPDTKVYCIRINGESGIKSFYQHSIVGEPLKRLLVTTEPVVISVQGPVYTGAANRQETSTSISHGTEAGHNPVARRPKRLRSDTQDCANKQDSAATYKHPLHGIDSGHSRSQQAQGCESDDISGYSGDEDHVKTETSGSRDAGKHQDSGLQDKTWTTSKAYDPTGPHHRASKRARLSSVTTEPAKSILYTADEIRDRVSKKVQFDVDNSEPTEPVSRANASDSDTICSRFATTVQLYEDDTSHAGE